MDTATSVSSSAFREALAFTTQLLETRARRYRTLVIAVLVDAFATAVWSGIHRSLTPVLGLLVLPVLCGLFFSIDAGSVNRWRTQILAFWTAGRLDIDDFHDTLASLKHLPSGTMAAMLASLPTRHVVGSPVGPLPAVRRALSESLAYIHALQATRSVAATVMWAIGAAAIAAAVIERSWTPCYAALLVLPCLGAGTILKVLRLRRWRREILALDMDTDMSSSFVEAASRLDWESIPRHRRDRSLRSLFPDQQPAKASTHWLS